MQCSECTQNKILRYMLNAPQRSHVGVNEFKSVEYRVEQLKLGHMYNITNGIAPDYLRANIDMVRNIYTVQEQVTYRVIQRVNGSGRSSFLYTGICNGTTCHPQPNNVTLKSF